MEESEEEHSTLSLESPVLKSSLLPPQVQKPQLLHHNLSSNPLPPQTSHLPPQTSNLPPQTSHLLPQLSQLVHTNHVNTTLPAQIPTQLSTQPSQLASQLSQMRLDDKVSNEKVDLNIWGLSAVDPIDNSTESDTFDFSIWDTSVIIPTKRKQSRFHFAQQETPPSPSKSYDNMNQKSKLPSQLNDDFYNPILQESFRALLPNVNINFTRQQQQQRHYQHTQQTDHAYNYNYSNYSNEKENGHININNNINININNNNYNSNINNYNIRNTITNNTSYNNYHINSSQQGYKQHDVYSQHAYSKFSSFTPQYEDVWNSKNNYGSSFSDIYQDRRVDSIFGEEKKDKKGTE